MKSDEASRLRDQIDLLVDGELDEPERKALLLGLDTVPDGWKQCAIAFLETQLFKQSLRLWQNRVTPVHVTLSQPSIQATAASRKRPWSRRFPMAVAVFVLAFLCGMMLPMGLFKLSQKQDNLPEIAGQPTFPDPKTPHLVKAGNGIVPFRTSGITSPFVSATPRIQRENGVLRTEYVTLPQKGGMGTMAVPCYLASDIEADRYLKSPPMIAPNEQEFIRHHGNEVNVYREHFVVPAGDKRCAVIPIDHVTVNFFPELNVL